MLTRDQLTFKATCRGGLLETEVLFLPNVGDFLDKFDSLFGHGGATLDWVPRQNGHHFAEDIFKSIFSGWVCMYFELTYWGLNQMIELLQTTYSDTFSKENVWHLIQIWLKYVQRGTINSLWPRDAIWWQGSTSTLVQVMACCLTAPSHYLIQCWLIITEAHWCSSEGNFAWDITAISH